MPVLIQVALAFGCDHLVRDYGHVHTALECQIRFSGLLGDLTAGEGLGHIAAKAHGRMIPDKD